MAKQQKYYVVWKGLKPGIYNTWAACEVQVKGFAGAQYKAFETMQQAQMAFNKGFTASFSKFSEAKKTIDTRNYGKPILQSVCVDAACSGNPGLMEYRGVDFATGKEIFKKGPYKEGTNNIGEFLALVRAAAMLQSQPNICIYTDSKIAMSWVKQKKCKTKLTLTAANQEIFKMISAAEEWLHNNEISNAIKKWETKAWGEIPADFGRK
jgi:ribonuclease HI